MLAGWFARGFGVALGTFAIAAMTVPEHADAATRTRAASHASFRSAAYARHYGRHYSGFLQCVPFARENSGIELSGNAGSWWGNADGLYERGARPEVGSILNFRATGRMRMGHVAVVTNVVDSRHIEIDHANWGGPGRVSRNMDVVDVSPANDWTAVRVALSPTDETLGSVYPTYGFIYDRPDRGVMLANTGVPHGAASAPVEVAEAMDDDAPRATRYHAARSDRHARYSGSAARSRINIRTSEHVGAARNEARVGSRSLAQAAPRSHTRTHRS